MTHSLRSAVRQALGQMTSDSKCDEVVRAVLGVSREPAHAAGDVLDAGVPPGDAERLLRERAEWGERVAAGPHVHLSVNQALLMAEFLGTSWRRVSAAWQYAMKNGVPIDPEQLKPPGESALDSPADRAIFAALSRASLDDREGSRDEPFPPPTKDVGP